jgi:hypothetical protein
MAEQKGQKEWNERNIGRKRKEKDIKKNSKQRRKQDGN